MRVSFRKVLLILVISLFSVLIIIFDYYFRGTKILNNRNTISFYLPQKNKVYCNRLFIKSLGDEGNVSDEYQLEAVFVVVRHGDRAPIYTFDDVQSGFKHPPRLHPSMPCNLARVHSSKPHVRRFLTHVAQLGGRTPRPPFHQFPLYPRAQFCRNSELTPDGALQHLTIGAHLRNAYKHRFPNLSHADVRAASTVWSRTFQSASALLFGLLGDDASNVTLGVAEGNRFCSIGADSFNACFCGRFNALAAADVHLINTFALRHSVTDRAADFLRRLGLPAAFPFSPGGALDALLPFVCNNVPLPCSDGGCITSEHLDALWRAQDAVWRQRSATLTFRMFAVLHIYPLLDTIVASMVAVLKSTTRHKFFLYSGHDNTVLPLLAALGAPTDSWPPYASRVIFELYTDRDTRDPYVRLIYNGKAVGLAFCVHAVTTTGGLCPLTVFSRFVSLGMFEQFGYTSYRNACAYTPNSPLFDSPNFTHFVSAS